jgi:ABC-type amino acid transport substrate-binding protein
MPEIAAVSPAASGPAFAVRGDANKSVTLIGIEPENYVKIIALDEKIVAGRLRLNAGEAVLGIELAKDLGAEVKFVDSSFAKLVDDVTADKCDIAMFAVGITPQRQEKLRFTQPHLVSDIYAITTQSNRRVQQWADLDKPGTVLVAAKGTIHESVMKTKLKAAELRVVDTPAAREQEVQSGRADAFMTDFPFSRRMLDNNDWARLVSPTETYHLTPYAWAMQPGDDAFHARVDKVLAAMKRDGRLLAHARKHGLEPIVAK